MPVSHEQRKVFQKVNPICMLCSTDCIHHQNNKIRYNYKRKPLRNVSTIANLCGVEFTLLLL
jgi:hypothetical protein